MKTLRDTLMRYSIKQVRVLLLTVIAACSLIPTSFPGTGSSTLNAYARNPL